jgi:hypothetical protein
MDLINEKLFLFNNVEGKQMFKLDLMCDLEYSTNGRMSMIKFSLMVHNAWNSIGHTYSILSDNFSICGLKFGRGM